MQWKLLFFSCPHRVSFTSFLSKLYIWNSLTAGEACWKIAPDPWVYLLERAWERWLSRGSIVFNTFFTVWYDSVVRPGPGKFSRSWCLWKFKTNTVALWILIPQRWAAFWGESLWQLLHTDMLVRLCIFWQCQDLERTHSMNNSLLLLFGPWENSSESKATRKCGISSCEFLPHWNPIATSWDCMWLSRQWVLFCCISEYLYLNGHKEVVCPAPYRSAQ